MYDESVQVFDVELETENPEGVSTLVQRPTPSQRLLNKVGLESTGSSKSEICEESEEYESEELDEDLSCPKHTVTGVSYDAKDFIQQFKHTPEGSTGRPVSRRLTSAKMSTSENVDNVMKLNIP
jgi:hypothetical protein